MKFKIIFLIVYLISLGLHVYSFARGIQRLFPSYELFENDKTLLQKYSLLSPRILQEYRNDVLIHFLPLRTEIRDFVSPIQNSFAVYFEYLPTGTSIGINEKVEFSAASLVKVPVVMAYLHQKERLGRKEDPVVTIEERDINKEYGTLWQKGVGTKISLGEAVEKALTESDNTAYLLLANRTEKRDLKHVMEGLDIDIAIENTEIIITAKHFSSILKALYFSSIVGKEDSQQILNLLTKSVFHDGIPAGVPKSVPVAHKIGVLDDELYQDCGIVYLPRRPYLLCMVSHSDENEANLRMRKISKMVYDYVSTTNNGEVTP